MVNHEMTRKQQLNILQRLKATADGCVEYSGLAPEGSELDVRLRRVGGEARDLFFSLTGLMPHNVEETELSNMRPSTRVAIGLLQQSHNWKGGR